MQQMKYATRAAKAETKALHDRAVDEIVRWLHQTRGIITSRVAAQQEQFGDFWYQIHPNEQPTYVLIKAEEENKYGNFFFEMWRHKANNEPGWLPKSADCVATYLGYYFYRNKELYMMKLQDLRLWALAFGNIEKFPEKEQFKRIQENDAWGRVVPIQVIMQAIKCHRYEIK